MEKRVTSSLLEGSSIEKIVEIDRHLGCAMSGLIADSRTMIDHARIEAQVGRLAGVYVPFYTSLTIVESLVCIR